MTKRELRAYVGLALLVFASFCFADAYGSRFDVGYNFGLAFLMGGTQLAIALVLFAWNVATYKK